MLALPNQTPHLIERYSLSRADVEREAWAIDSGGRKYAGAEAFNRVLRELRGLWPLVAALYSLAPVRWLEDRAYRWIAEHRHWLSRLWGTAPECDEPGACM